MSIKHRSYFKNEEQDRKKFRSWVDRIKANNNREYQEFEVQTRLGKTHIWGLGTTGEKKHTLFIFPGYRTTTLFWDFERTLDRVGKDVQIYLVETNGQPNLSDGNTPSVKSLDYGHWAMDIFKALKVEKAFIAGASFGGQICMKIALVAPEKVQGVFLLNPGCLQMVSLKLKNIYYTLLPIISPSEKNVDKFLNKSVFHKPEHQVSKEDEKLILDYQYFALTRYVDKADKPYAMGKEMLGVKTSTYLLLGDKDVLFPVDRSISNAKKYIPGLKQIEVFKGVGHGIETHIPAIEFIGKVIHQ